MRSALRSAAGLAASLALHGAGAAALVLLVVPEEMPSQPPPQSELTLETAALERRDAEARPAEGEAAEGVEPETGLVQGGAVATARARPADADASPAEPGQAAGARLSGQAPTSEALPERAKGGEAARPLAESGTRAEAAALPGQVAPEQGASAQPAVARPAEGRAAPDRAPAGSRISETTADADPLAATSMAAPRLTTAEPPASAALPASPSDTLLAGLAPDQARARTQDLDGAAATTLAPADEGEARVGPVDETAPRVAAVTAAGALAEESAPDSARLTDQTASSGARLSATDDAAPRASALAAVGAEAPTEIPEGARLSGGAVPAQALVAGAPQAAPAGEGALASLRPAAFRPDAPTAAAPRPDAPAANASRPETPTAAAPRPDVSAAETSRPDAPAAPAPPPEAGTAPSADLPAAEVTARLAWSAEDLASADPATLAALTAFLSPEQAGAEGEALRDGIAGLMASVPCARLQTAFDPETGTLELRGHVPEDGVRGPLAEALQAQVGPGLPVADRLRLLPAPQCDVLGRVEALGLPQSEEQFTDPHLIGENLFVREYAFAAGARMEIALEAADYPAYIYVDYYDAEGNVLHLMPNDILPLRRHAPAEPFTIGAEGSGLELIVEPPFGTDIAVAFATDTPLYDGLRPIIEPAGPYLDFLRARIAAVAPGRGEWAYLFVATGPPR
ncbi:MAG: DUF4384 domain-containing protein [Pseudomonadota bacterium]